MKFLIAIIAISLFLSCGFSDQTPGESYQAIMNWQFRNIDDPTNKYIEAEVPGSVMTDLLNSKLIPDYFYGDNEKLVQWIGTSDWEYKSYFTPSAELRSKQNQYLVFEGLDTYARVYLNDSLILESNNMFIKHEIAVGDLIKVDSNELRIRFRSPLKMDSIKQSKHPFLYPDSRSFTRKAPYQYGWDWGPKLISMGIWKPVYLKGYNSFAVSRISAFTDSINDDFASGRLNLEINADEKQQISITASIQNSNQYLIDTTLHLNKGINLHPFTFSISNPKLWWPNEAGKQNLYSLAVSINSKQQKLDTVINYGIRKIELDTSIDNSGQKFTFNVNGRSLFIKGANYIPMNSFPSNSSKEKLKDLLIDCKSTGFNMLRVWGGGIYPQDYFYHLCDSLGIMVWQDFMFACNFYPGDDKFMLSVNEEVSQQVSRISGHPSLAIWCGNNEIDEAWHNWGYQEALSYSAEDQVRIWNDYLSLFEFGIPKWIDKIDSQTAYIPTSPKIGWGHEEALNEGDMHYWGVWWGEEPFEMYEDKVGRFMSEYGFQSFPSVAVMDKYMKADTLDLEAAILVNHQKHPRGMQLIKSYMERDFNLPEDPWQYAYVSQLLQARGMSIAIEAQRRSKPYCMGTLYWQLNDCWPSISWSSIDYQGNWKAFHYELKRIYAPVLLSFEEVNDVIKLYLIDDVVSSTSNTYISSIKLMDFEGSIYYDTLFSISSNVESAQIISELNRTKLLKNLNEKELLLHAEVKKEGMQLAEKNYYFLPPKSLKLNEAILSYRDTLINDANALMIKSNTLVKNLYIHGEDENLHFLDNYFDLLPGEIKIISLQQNQGIKSLPFETLNFRSLNPALIFKKE